MRLIDADATLDEAKRLSGSFSGDGWDNWGVYALIERQPTIDAVPVVRCKDCCCLDPVGKRVGSLDWCIMWHHHVVPDGFCHIGERKDDV